MKIKRLVQLGTATVLSVSSLLLCNLPLAHAAGPTDNWVGGTDLNWSTAANWDNGVPVDGEDLVFDVTTLVGNTTLNNDIPSLDLNSVTFQGSNGGSFAFTIGGNDLTVDDGITDSTNVSDDQLDVNITLGGDQTFTNVNIGPSNLLTLDIGLFNLSVLNGDIAASISGNGTLNVGNNTSDNTTFETASSNFPGTVELVGTATLLDANAFGTANVTVDAGGMLFLQSVNVNETIANGLTLSGTGAGGAGALQISLAGGAGGTLTLSGDIVLAADTLIGNSINGENETVNFTGTVTKNGHALNAATNVTLGGTALQAAEAADAAAAAAAKALGAPNTGLAPLAGNPLAVIIAASIAAATLLGVAYRFRRGLNSGR